MRRWTLKAKMTCIVSVLTATILSGTAFVALRHFEKEFRRTVAHHQLTYVTALAVEIDYKLRNAHHQLMAVAELLSADLSDTEGAGRILSSQGAALVTFDNGLFLFSAQGKLLTGSAMEPHMWGRDYHYRDYYQETVRTGRPHISTPFFSTQGHGHPIVMMTVPVLDETGELAAIVAGSLDLATDDFLGTLIEGRHGEEGYLHLFSADGTILLHPDRRRILTRDLSADGAEFLAGSGEMVDLEGVQVLRSWKPLQSTNWLLAFSSPIAQAYAPINQARRYFIAGLGAVVPLCTFFAWLFMQLVTAPLSRIARHVRAITEGRVDLPPLPASPHEEIATLARAFNTMQEEISRKRRAVQDQKEFAEALVQCAAAPIFVIDRHHKVIAWNGACEKLTGLSAAEVKGTNLQWQGFYDYQRPCLADFVIDNAFDELSSYFSAHSPARLVGDGVEAEGWRRTWGGRHCYLIFSAAPIRNSNGEIVAAIETLEDITERKEAESRLAQMAHFDFLTGLPNRALFFDRLDLGVTEAQRYGHNLALLYLDLNGFKEINDSFGHDAGDGVLVQLADRLKECVRTCDTVARMGGDEFIIILGRITDPADAALVTRRIRKAFASPFVLSSRIVRIGASIGISVFPHDGTDGETLLKEADTAMYRAKAAGGILFAGDGPPFYDLASDGPADTPRSMPE